MTSHNPRQIYLLETLGLSHDPFAGPVAEQELHVSHIEQESGPPPKKPHFFSYYIDPNDINNKPVLQALRQARNGFIFGRPGSGKTTLRYTLEAECRSVYDGTLVVTYELGGKIGQPATAEQHWRNLAVELATDLFIQAIEQFGTSDLPVAFQKQQFQGQMALIWPRLRRTVKLLLENDYSRTEHGLATLWPRLQRPAVRYIAPTSKIISLIKECLPAKSLPHGSDSSLAVQAAVSADVSDNTSSGKTLLEAGITAAKAWGFQQIFILVDGIDAYQRDVDHMLALIGPLLNNLAAHSVQNDEPFRY